MSADRRYKLIGQGLPGNADFEISDLSNGETVVWNSTTGKWDNQAAAATQLDELSDVTLTTETTGDILYYNGSQWVNTDAITVDPAGSVTLANNGSVVATVAASGLVIETAGTNALVTLEDTDTEIGQLRKNSSGEFELRNTEHGGHILLSAENGTGTAVEPILDGDPDGNTLIYAAGEPYFYVTPGGVEVVSDSGNDPFVDFYDDNRTNQWGRIVATSTEFEVRSVRLNNHVMLTATDGVGVQTGVEFDPATGVAFNGGTPTAPPTYTPTNVTTDRSYDANATSTAELADVLGTLIADLQAIGLLA